MDSLSFWNVIAQYNRHTLLIQLILFAFITTSIIIAYKKRLYFLPKIALGTNCLWIGIAFFLYFGTEPIQYFFAAPLFLAIGILFLYEAKKNPADILQKPGTVACVLLAIVLLYPLISYLLGNVYPATVLLVMPCPMISLCILIYSRYRNRNRLLMVLLIVWGMTGIKSLFFNVYEDLILLVCGFYGISLLVSQQKARRRA